MVHWVSASRSGSLGGTRQNGSLGWYTQKWFIGMVQAVKVHWDGASGNGSLGWYKLKWFIGMVQAEMALWDSRSRNGY